MKIKDYKKLTHKKWLNLFDIIFADKFGHQRTWQVASRHQIPKCISAEFKKPDAVLIIPFHKTEQKMVIIREYRISLGGFQYEFPAGLVDEGETIEAAAKRELQEETGLSLTRINKISPALYNTAGMTDESVALVYCECEGVPSNSQNEGSEDIHVCLVSPSEASRIMADATAKFDAKLWIELTHFTSAAFQ
jgi:ADP-ribose pyrophosphatase